jgi:hypothetical protein
LSADRGVDDDGADEGDYNSDQTDQTTNNKQQAARRRRIRRDRPVHPRNRLNFRRSRNKEQATRNAPLKHPRLSA